MGANNVQIKLSPTHQYVGQVNNNVPHGKGNLNIFTPGNLDQKQWAILGQFQNGQIIKCKAHSLKDKLIYEGQVKAGKFTGKGRLTSESPQMIWQGQFENGVLLSGQIKKQGQYQCKGIFKIESSYSKTQNQNESKPLYQINGEEGSYKNLKNNQKIYGAFQKGQLSGSGTYEFQDGDSYIGGFKNGQFQGKGVYKAKQSSFKQITGLFSKSEATHNPKLTEELHRIEFINGDIFEGTLKQNKMHGPDNTYYFSDGTVYKGSFNNDSLTGQCEIKYGEKSKIERYKGEVLDGLFNGLGVIQYKNGVILKGYFLKNAKNGPCILIFGQRMFKCLYIMDQLIGQMIQIPSKAH